MILHPTNIVHFVMIFVQKTDKIFWQDKILSYCECLVRFPDKKNTLSANIRISAAVANRSYPERTRYVLIQDFHDD